MDIDDYDSQGNYLGKKKESENVDIACVIEHETEKAYLINDGQKSCWIPKSQVVSINGGEPDDYQHKEGASPVFTMTQWIAEKNGLV